MNKDVEDVFSIIDEFGVMNIDDSQFNSMKRGDIQALGEEFSNMIVLDESSDQKLIQLETILNRYACKNDKSKKKNNNQSQNGNNIDEINSENGLNSNDESIFWSMLCEKEIPPIMIEALCFMLLGKESSVYNHGIILYSILLRMEPASSIWNPNLFKPILSVLITAQQIIESGEKLNDQTKSQLDLTQILLTNLTAAISTRNFLNMIGFEVLLALDEITVKLITGSRVEFDKYNESISNLSIKFLQTIAESKSTSLLNDIIAIHNNENEDNNANEIENNDEDENEEESNKKKKKKRKDKPKSNIIRTVEQSDHVDYLLPFLVPQLLLQFASNSTSLTSRIDKIREKLTDLILKILKPEDKRIITVCKHLICRVPDKSHLRRGVAQTIFKISKSSIYIKDIIEFIVKASKATKIGIRSFSSLLVQLYLVNISEISQHFGDESSEIVISLSTVLKRQLMDQAPTVRAIALEGVSQIIDGLFLESNQFGTIISNVIDSNGYLEMILAKRISDEKVIVRRAALLCANQIIQSGIILSKYHFEESNKDMANEDENNTNENKNENNENNSNEHKNKYKDDILSVDDKYLLINLVATRTRDRSVSIRQLAIRSLNSAISLHKENEDIHMIWLDSVLPLIVDPENTVQNEALDSVTANFLDPIIKGEREIFTSIMKQIHFDFMKNVFALYKQKSIPLAKISKALTKKLQLSTNSGKETVQYNNDISIWKLIEILTRVETSHFKPKDFTQMWKLKDECNLPPEYYLILANLKCQKPKIKNDCLRIVERELQGNTRQFSLMHGVIQLLSIQEGNDNNLILNDLLTSCCSYINQMAQSDSTREEDIVDLMTTIYTLGELVSLLDDKKLFDFNFVGLELLISDNLPNGAIIPANIRALSTISLGKLCIMRKDISTSFVSAFAHLLSRNSNSDPSIKCDTLIVMCDLCVRYSALVDPHVVLMTNCFADESSVVRHQTLHVITRLIVEDYLKMRPLLFFKYVYAITDDNEETASFARCCLFNVLLSKSPSLLTSHFIDTIYYFSTEVKIPGIFESEEENLLFQITDKERRQNGLFLLISKMNEISAFQMIQLICNNLLNRYVKEEFNIYDHKNILDDAIFSLIELEDKMKEVMESEVLNEDQVTEKVVEAGKKMINDIHNNMIQNVLPILNFMLRKLRDLHSPLQNQLKQFYQRICTKNPNLIKQLVKTEPFLAAELQKEMEAQISVDENENEIEDENQTPQSSQFTTPTRRKKKTSFSTPLLSQIASTPRSKLCSPAAGNQNLPNSPRIRDSP